MTVIYTKMARHGKNKKIKPRRMVAKLIEHREGYVIAEKNGRRFPINSDKVEEVIF